MRAASKPAFLAPSIATQPTGTPGGIWTADSSASSPPRALAGERHADHRQVGVRRGDARQGGRHPGAGDDHLQAPHPGRVAVLAHLLGVAVGAHHPDLVADPVLVQRLAGRLHLRLVVRRAHDDPDQRRVDLDLLERRLDLGHRLRGRRLGLAVRCVPSGSAISIDPLPSLPAGFSRRVRRLSGRDPLDRPRGDVGSHLHARRTRSGPRPRRLGRAPRRALARAR